MLREHQKMSILKRADLSPTEERETDSVFMFLAKTAGHRE